MKESKCGKIPRCYSGKKFRIHEELEKIKAGDETHDMVYELNKQMCDLEIDRERWDKIGEEWASKKKGIVDSIFNKIDMEKKINPMTKAEAFEYLKGKKVYANGKGKEVQMKLFECGVSWATNHFVYYDFGDYLLIDTDGYLYHCGHEGGSYWRAHHFKEISADDILSLEIVEEKKEETENINIELEKWIGVIRDKFCCNGWSFVISASNFAFFSGDLIEEKRIKE